MKYILFFIIFILVSTISYKLGNDNKSKPIIKYLPALKTIESSTNPIPTPTVIVKTSIPLLPNTAKDAYRLIDTINEETIEEKMLLEFGENGTESITDKKIFLKHLTDIYFEDNNTIDEDIVGATHSFISLTTNEEDESIDEIELNHKNASQRLYAHLSLDNDTIDNTGQVLIKWKNISTGKTLLFTRKAINSNSAQNWVSFIPDNGWRKGEYEVDFFNFSDTLIPLSKSKYIIY